MDKNNPLPEKIITLRPNGTKRVSTKINGLKETQDQFKEQCDVNNIIAKYVQTGTVSHVRNAQQGVYADLSEIPSYQEALQVVIHAEHAFGEVPAHIRNRFQNDPQQFINFLSNPENDAEAIKLGLKVLPKSPEANPILEELKLINKNTSKTKTPNPNPEN